MHNQDTSMFSLLAQDGPLATRDTIAPAGVFSPDARKMAAALRVEKGETKYRILRNQIFDLLNVRSFAEVANLIHDRQQRRVLTAKVYRLLGNMFGIQGTDNEVVTTIKSYSRTADGVIRYLKSGVMSPYASYIEMTNEVDALSNPVDLLLMVFDNRYHKKARFEAKRKLVLMSLAGSIDQRERETDVEAKFAEFLGFLNRHVWSSSAKIGELEMSYLLSEHSEKDYSCTHWRILSHEQAQKVVPQANQKLTLLKRRRFDVHGKSVPIYVSIRKKPPETKVLKLLRKREENPAVAVDDELGLMGVLDSLADVKKFQAHLTRSAIAADSLMALEDVSDTLTTKGYRTKNAGSSTGTRMLKFFARLGGMRVEFIVHTNDSYLDYMFQRDVAHDEYECKRIFDSGAAALLFPEEIYFLDMKKARTCRMERTRRQLESC